MAIKTFQQISYATRTLFDALINGNRGYQAPYTNDDKALSVEAVAMLGHGGPAVLGAAPAVALTIKTIPQSADFTQAVQMSRMLGPLMIESTSGGWVAPPYSFDPPPSIPDIILPQAQWNTFGGETELTGLSTQPTPVGAIYSAMGMPMPEFAYPGIIGSSGQVTSDGSM